MTDTRPLSKLKITSPKYNDVLSALLAECNPIQGALVLNLEVLVNLKLFVVQHRAKDIRETQDLAQILVGVLLAKTLPHVSV
jgi:hypothetical protein